MIIPEVTLLNMDQIAKRAIPKIAKTDEKITAISSNFAPKTKASISRASKNKLTVT